MLTQKVTLMQMNPWWYNNKDRVLWRVDRLMPHRLGLGCGGGLLLFACVKILDLTLDNRNL